MWSDIPDNTLKDNELRDSYEQARKAVSAVHHTRDNSPSEASDVTVHMTSQELAARILDAQNQAIEEFTQKLKEYNPQDSYVWKTDIGKLLKEWRER